VVAVEIGGWRSTAVSQDVGEEPLGKAGFGAPARQIRRGGVSGGPAAGSDNTEFAPVSRGLIAVPPSPDTPLVPDTVLTGSE